MEKNFILYAKNSAVVAVINTLLAFLVAIPAAYGLD
jgi:ABC-type glycerol-3-phosphate transport system permease component